MQRLVIVGAGGHGREVLDIVEAMNKVEPTYEMLGFVASHGDLDLLARRDVALLGDVDELAKIDGSYVLAVGMPWDRRTLADQVEPYGLPAATVIHPAATIGGDNRIGPGVVVAAGAHITTNVDIGRHVHLNVGAVVSHDCFVGAYTTLSPGSLVNGNVELQERVFVGTGAVIIPGCRIGADARIGAGAVVVGDLPPGVTAKGVPARWR